MLGKVRSFLCLALTFPVIAALTLHDVYHHFDHFSDQKHEDAGVEAVWSRRRLLHDHILYGVNYEERIREGGDILPKHVGYRNLVELKRAAHNDALL